jgi:deazaflavin-dependent oxidoreductase (nitroreductase family)
MDEQLSNALAFGHTIDITTTGRRTGLPRRIEIVFHRIGGRLIVSGSPRVAKRAWLRNLEADPRLTFHLKGAVAADLPATARIITDEADRRAIADWLVAHAWPTMDAAAIARYSPMIEITLEELAA